MPICVHCQRIVYSKQVKENLFAKKVSEIIFPEPILDSEGRTPLHWAVDRGHLNITEFLVRKNADVNAKVT